MSALKNPLPDADLVVPVLTEAVEAGLRKLRPVHGVPSLRPPADTDNLPVLTEVIEGPLLIARRPA